MGYDMSDSIFMQEMQAAGREKESKKALEERTALEAFRAAALQVRMSLYCFFFVRFVVFPLVVHCCCRSIMSTFNLFVAVVIAVVV